jgi:hypothetical protein
MGRYRFLALLGAILLAAFATPTFAEKMVISDKELDKTTAEGQKKIVQPDVGTGESGTAMTKKAQFNNVSGPPQKGMINGQDNLNALTLNNVLGTNQVANGVNIGSR